MSKSNATAAGQAEAPEKINYRVDQPHSRNYPGRKAPKAEKVVEASHSQSTQDAGRRASLGVSANGSHKGLPVSYEYVGHKSGAKECDAPMSPAPKTAAAPKHDQAALDAGRTNSMGTSANGSHKGVPTSKAQVGQV